VASRVGRSPRRDDDRGRCYRDQVVGTHLDHYEHLLVRLAAQLTGQNMSEFMREAAVSLALVAVDTARKHRLALDKGVRLYGEDPAGRA
jgi:hypothetical protein